MLHIQSDVLTCCKVNKSTSRTVFCAEYWSGISFTRALMSVNPLPTSSIRWRISSPMALTTSLVATFSESS